jgi:hypothetical protein
MTTKYSPNILALKKYDAYPSSFYSIGEEIRYHNTWTDFWRQDIGVNVILANTKIKKKYAHGIFLKISKEEMPT